MYVITAALRNIWPDEGSLLFPGEWSYKYKDLDDIKKRDALVVEEEQYPLDFKWKYWQSHYASTDIIIELLYQKLNELHGCTEDLGYWKAIIGKWLYSFVTAYECSYSIISRIIDTYSNDTFIVVKIDFDTQMNKRICGYIKNGKLIKYSKEEKFEFQFYLVMSNIIVWLKENYNNDIRVVYDQTTYVWEDSDENKHDKVEILEVVKEKIKDIVCYKPVLAGLYDHDRTYYIILKSKRKIRFDLPKFIFEYESNSKYNLFQRRGVLLEYNGQNKAIEMVCALLPYFIPMSYVEDYYDLMKYAKRLPKAPKLVNLQQISNPNVMVIVGEWKKRGTKLAREACSLADQMMYKCEPYHYGMDYYYVWSRFLPEDHFRFKPTYKRLEYNGAKLFNNKEGILWAGSGNTVNDSYGIMAGNIAQLYDARTFMVDFLDKCQDSIFADILYRDRDNAKWGNIEYYKRKFPNLKIENKIDAMGVNFNWMTFSDRCKKSRLVIAETLDTGVVGESFCVNTPTIVINTNSYDNTGVYYDQVLRLIEEMKNNNMLFDNPIAAAEFVNNNYFDIEKWWYSDSVQSIKDDFLREFFYVEKNIDSWLIEEIKSVDTV